MEPSVPGERGHMCMFSGSPTHILNWSLGAPCSTERTNLMEATVPITTKVRSCCILLTSRYTAEVKKLLHLSDAVCPCLLQQSAFLPPFEIASPPQRSPVFGPRRTLQTLGPRTAVDQALHRLVAFPRPAADRSAASTTPPRTTGLRGSPPIPTHAT